MGAWTPLYLLVICLVCSEQCFGQAPCTPVSDTCPDDFTCDVAASICQPTVRTSPTLQQNITAYIIMGVILGVIVIIVIVILVVSCGRWNWSWRNANNINNRKAVRVSRTTNMIRRIHKKPKLKLGLKKNTNFETIQSDNSGSSRALFVMGESGIASEPEREVQLRPPAGPHVARVELDSSVIHGPIQPATISSSYNQRQPEPSHIITQPACPHCSNPSVSRVSYPDVRQPECQIHGSSAIYPQLGDIRQPQHQINIHAAVPAAMSTIQQPIHQHHHQQVAHQPVGLYPNLGHTHAQVITPHPTGHVHSSMHLSPPAYQTMERTLQKY